MMIQTERMMGRDKGRGFPKGLSPLIDSLSSMRQRSAPIEHMPTLIKLLREGDHFDRTRACLDIADLAKKDKEKAKEALPALREAFERWGPLSKCLISEVFVALGDGRALPALVKHMDRRHPETKARLEWAIRNIPAIELKVIGRKGDGI